TGEETFRKADYDTNENRKLIELNLRLFEAAGYKGNYLLEFSPQALNSIAALHGRIESDPYRSFIKQCDEHQPWIWKDPRLWLTIRFWKDLLDLDQCQFILLTRGTVQSWISSTLRRQITTYRYSKRYEENIKTSALQFLTENRLPYLSVSYEELIERPVETIRRLNEYLETALTIQ